jgi:hypothetical protein
LRVTLLVAPIVFGFIAYRFCKDLKAEEGDHAPPKKRLRAEPPAPERHDGDEHHTARDAAGAVVGAGILRGLAALGRRRKH